MLEPLSNRAFTTPNLAGNIRQSVPLGAQLYGLCITVEPLRPPGFGLFDRRWMWVRAPVFCSDG